MIRLPPNLDPEYLEHNLKTLSEIGGVYDFIVACVEWQHRDILAAYRATLDSGAKPVIGCSSSTDPAVTGQSRQRKTNAET